MKLISKLKKGDFISCKSVERIQNDAFKILEDIGIKISDPEILEAVLAQGYSEVSGRVRIPISKSKAFLDSLKDCDWLRQETEQKLSRTQYSGVLCSYAMRLADPHTKTVKAFTTESLVKATQFARLCEEELGGFQSWAPGVASDIPPELEALQKYKISAMYGSGPIPIEPTSVLSAQHMFSMAEIVGQPITRLPVYTISPLCLGGESAQLVWKFRDKLSSFYVFAMPMLGCSAPLTIQGGLSMGLAEVLGAGLLMHEVTGLPCLIRPKIYPMDLRVVNYAFGSPRTFLYECLSEDFTAQLLDLPVNYHSTNIHTNAALSGAQSALEKTSLMTAGAMLGATKFYCVGSLSLDEVFSPVELVLDSLRVAQISELMQPLQEDYYEDIVEFCKQYVDQGFLMSDATLDDHEDYINYSRFINRGPYTDDSSYKEMAEHAESTAQCLFGKECDPILSAEQISALEECYNHARNRL